MDGNTNLPKVLGEEDGEMFVSSERMGGGNKLYCKNGGS